ncbi:MAG: T9SS type A sorting domain-containing protein [Bacteroidota bacterium]
MKKTITIIVFFITSVYSQSFLEPPDGKIYHGTQIAFESHLGYIEALNDSTLNPAVRGIFLAVPGTRPPATTYNNLRKFLFEADSIGFIPEISLFLETNHDIPNGATDSIIAVSTEYDYFIDSLIEVCRIYGQRMFIRIGGEFNGWWNGGGYHPYYYVIAFRKIVDMFATKDFRDSIATVWCYEPDAANDFDSVGINGPLWYPGDEYVDWFGLDVFDYFHFDQSLPDYNRGVITQKGKSERFLEMARTKMKPVFLNETSAKAINITADSIDSANDWSNWFAKFWEFIDNHTEIKGFNYINAEWESSGFPGWGDARIQNSTYIAKWYKEEIQRDKYIHLQTSTPVSIKPVIAFPEQFVLYQNYPNPFNPSTTISYKLQASSYVTLKVYDILGREIATLVNEYQQPGKYFVHFNVETHHGASLPNGVYFYKLQAGSFVQSRKMLLLK